MSPTLSPSYSSARSRDRVLVLKRASPLTHVRSNVQRGDIVTFGKPHEPDGQSVKRVIGLAGDVIWRDIRRVGKERDNGGQNASRMGMTMLPPVVKVPIGHVWVEGDNWRESLDSNDFGPVRKARLRWKHKTNE